MNEKNINIRVVDWEPPQIIHYTQGGTEIPLVFNILDYEIPSGATARIYILKPSKKQVYNSCTVDGNSISYKPTAQSFIEAGRNLVKLQVVVGQDLLFSFTLFVDVEPNFINEDAIESTDEYGALDDLIIQAQEALDEMTKLNNFPFYPYYGSGTEGDMGSLAEVDGGHYSFPYTEEDNTGYLRISLPTKENVLSNNSMVAFDIVIASCTLAITGIYSVTGELYTTGTGAQDGWSAPSAVFYGKQDNALSNLPVVFGMDQTTKRRYVQIGNADTNWGIGAAVIKNVRSFWNIYGANNWQEGWGIEITKTAIPTPTTSVDPTIVQPISSGGTGETNRVDAMAALLNLPNNTVPAEDTPAAWAELGNCTIYYNTTPSGFGFPSTYGTLIQFVNNDSVATVQQIWLRQAYGMFFNRAGNSVGWNEDADLTGEDSWNQVFTTRDLSPLYKAMFADGGSIASNSNLDNFTTPGRYYTSSSNVSASLTNTPFPSNAFEMEVGFEFNGGITGGTTTVWQRAYVTSTGAEAFRRRYNNVWSDWTYTAVLGSNGALPIADGGTGATTVSGALSALGLSNAIIMNSLSPSNWSIPANSARGGEIKGNLDGYDGYMPTVVSCYCTNNYSVVILNAWIDGSYSSAGNGFIYHIDARNLSDSTVAADFTIRILWLKENISS